MCICAVGIAGAKEADLKWSCCASSMQIRIVILNQESPSVWVSGLEKNQKQCGAGVEDEEKKEKNGLAREGERVGE